MYFSTEDRRRHERISAPAISVELDGQVYCTTNWSMGGFVIDGYEGRYTPGSLITLERIADTDGALAPVLVRARAVRADRWRQRLVVGFLGVDERAYAILRDHMTQRMQALRQHQAF